MWRLFCFTDRTSVFASSRTATASRILEESSQGSQSAFKGLLIPIHPRLDESSLLPRGQQGEVVRQLFGQRVSDDSPGGPTLALATKMNMDGQPCGPPALCLNQDLLDSWILKMGTLHPANPSILIILIQIITCLVAAPSPHEKTLTLARSQPLRPRPSMVPVRRGVPPSILTGPGEPNPATPLKPFGIRGIRHPWAKWPEMSGNGRKN